MGVSTKSKLIKRKKKSAESKLTNGESPLDIILGRHEFPTGLEQERDASPPPPPPPDDPLHRLCSPDELAAIRQRIKAKQKEARETPKLFFQLDRVKAAAGPAKLLATESFVDDEHLKSVFVDVAVDSSRSATFDGEPFLFPFDVQELLLRGLLGGRYVPRWCNLLRFKFVTKVALVVVDGVSEKEWDDHVECFPHLQCMMPELPVKLLPPEVQGTTLLTELFNIPFSLSEVKEFDYFDNFFRSTQNDSKHTQNDSKHTQNDSKQAQAEQLLRWIEETKRKCSESTAPMSVATDAEMEDVEAMESASSRQRTSRIPATIDAISGQSLATDGVLTWVDVDRHVDVTSRRDLLLTEADMARESFPLSYNLAPQFAAEFVHSLEGYEAVTSSSPLFAVDCEMCYTARKALELTHIAVVDEKLRCVLQTYVKPEAKIVNYLTEFSGITAKDMARPDVMTLKDVQRKLSEFLPSDAILVGHSLNGDLTAMRMIHPYVIDTSVIFNLRGHPDRKSKLRDLTYVLLDRKIQEFNAKRKGLGHDPLEDAKATMELTLLKLRNGPGFADFTAIENEEKWPGGLREFISWYEGIARKQRKKRLEEKDRELLKEETVDPPSTQVDGKVEGEKASKDETLANAVEEKPLSDSVGAADSKVRIPLRDAFLKRSAAAQRQNFRDALDQLRIQRHRAGAVVDHEEVLEAVLRKSTGATKRSAPTDKLIVKEALKLVPDHFFVCVQLHRYRKLIEAETERRRDALKKLDKRFKKIYDSLPAKAMIVVVFGGRKWSETESVEASKDAKTRRESFYHHGLVFGGIKTK